MSRSWPYTLLVFALLAGCKQGEGDRCEVDSDCSSGLVCAQAITGGRCAQPNPTVTVRMDGSPGTADAVAPDTAPTRSDGARTDAPTDGAARADAAVDAPGVDAAAADAPAADAPAPDASARAETAAPTDAAGN